MKVKRFNIISNILAAIALFHACTLEMNNLQYSIPALICVIAAIRTFISIKIDE